MILRSPSTDSRRYSNYFDLVWHIGHISRREHCQGVVLADEDSIGECFHQLWTLLQYILGYLFIISCMSWIYMCTFAIMRLISFSFFTSIVSTFYWCYRLIHRVLTLSVWIHEIWIHESFAVRKGLETSEKTWNMYRVSVMLQKYLQAYMHRFLQTVGYVTTKSVLNCN